MLSKRYLFIFILVLAVIFAAVFFVTKGQNSSQNKVYYETASQSNKCSNIKSTLLIAMKDSEFQPETLTVERCTKVVFENKDTKSHWPASNLHPTHGIYPEFDPQQGVEPGKDWSFIFDKVGKWRYHDHLFPSVKGEIIVNE